MLLHSRSEDFPGGFATRGAVREEELFAEMVERLADQLAQAKRLAEKIARRYPDFGTSAEVIATGMDEVAHDACLAHFVEQSRIRTGTFHEETGE